MSADILPSIRRFVAVFYFPGQPLPVPVRTGAELNFLPDNVFRRHRRLAVFDMDSTLIQQEVIDEIARSLGPVFQKQVSDITERAMNGELDFTASLRERVALLKGVKVSVFEELKSVIRMTQGVPDLIKVLKRLGYKTAVLSGGFMPLTGWLAKQLELDYAHANNLVVSTDGKTLTGELEGVIVNAEMKRDLVLEIAQKEGILLEQTLVVGDGANDLKMMGVSGLGVAFNAKPKVQVDAPARLNSSSLLDVMHLLGFTKDELNDLLI
ncbi:phosphoserine phosphatase serb [Eremomyces bilateralis CBS 781.70]|uniref:phosphoserine phosphatase n=1 Tax=Eremomyces bilateralis CBS 781.70 TaxID=1392243 RepID=A0A6G1G7W3_9PEZI|nr:phosphoserine phosphatase serb [Eremomyces bilateralis CBS 781.70]KAF1813980.1 phosphoserine phosphatase serb [Eremomyces bilateralis CBS 781.70]